MVGTLAAMILINVVYRPKPEYVENFREKVADFTEATRAEEGNIFFDWYRSTDDPGVYVLLEAFQDDAAEAHVNSQHFKEACELFPELLLETPKIINTTIPGKTEWDRMAEFAVD
ncbi:putative monooxygenase YcnE [Corynebacterium lowii]|uniref:Putative monooxygenase YcnE n=2 Tax=Corynebacterium lowii TaxID=1544413 RepID=A0A0Q0UHT6_9CORY|nr:putative monooxygenase YcnE [Corynebacterium lowii]